MRMSTRNLRSSLVAWWLFAFAVWAMLWFVFDVPLLGATITVLSLADGKYADYGVFRRGDVATSALLEGFMADVDAVLDAK